MNDDRKSDVKLLIASPIKGQPAVAYMSSVLKTKELLETKHGIPTSWFAVPDNAWIGHGRAAIAANFLASEHTHLLMIDADISWHPKDVVRMLRHDVPFVAAIQPSRKDSANEFQLGARGKSRGKFKYDTKAELLHVERISAAFQLIRRDCLEGLKEAHPDLYAYQSASWFLKDNEAARPHFYAFWEQRLRDGEWPGEDHAFCDRMIDAGMEVLVDPWIKLGHWVEVCKHGCLADYYNLGNMVSELAERGEAA